MKLKIGDKEYDAVSFEGATPLHLMELQRQAPALVDGGLGMSRLHAMRRSSTAYGAALRKWRDAGADPETEPLLPDDAAISLAAMMFLARRAAGEMVTFAEAAAQTYTIVREPDDDDPGGDVEPDPTIPGLDTPEILGDVQPEAM